MVATAGLDGTSRIKYVVVNNIWRVLHIVEARGRLTLQQVARELGRSLEQVRRYVREGKLPAQKLGMQWFVERRSLEAFKGTGGGMTREDVLVRARRLREKIREQSGRLDVVKLLDDSRGGRPFVSTCRDQGRH